MQVRCPTCRIKHEYRVESAFRPFCSERCKMIDLGAWANDEYKLPTQDAPQADNSGEQDEF